MKKHRTLSILVIALLAGLAFWFVAKRFTASSLTVGPEAPDTGSPVEPVTGENREAPAVAVTVTEALPSRGGSPVSEETPDEAVLTEDEVWKERLLDLLRDDTYSDLELGRQLLSVVADPQAPDWARAHAMTNALNFTDDENYGAEVKPLALRTDLPEVVNDAILEDLINRDPAAILPVAREFAAAAQHPLAGAIDAFVKEAEKADLP